MTIGALRTQAVKFRGYCKMSLDMYQMDDFRCSSMASSIRQWLEVVSSSMVRLGSLLKFVND